VNRLKSRINLSKFYVLTEAELAIADLPTQTFFATAEVVLDNGFHSLPKKNHKRTAANA
jgi:hypothetical protein